MARQDTRPAKRPTQLLAFQRWTRHRSRSCVQRQTSAYSRIYDHRHSDSATCRPPRYRKNTPVGSRECVLDKDKHRHWTNVQVLQYLCRTPRCTSKRTAHSTQNTHKAVAVPGIWSVWDSWTTVPTYCGQVFQISFGWWNAHSSK